MRVLRNMLNAFFPRRRTLKKDQPRIHSLLMLPRIAVLSDGKVLTIIHNPVDN